MTVPESKLILKIDVAHMTLGDAAVFDGKVNPVAIRTFLLKYGNWDTAAVDGIEMAELGNIADQLLEQFRAAAIPLASAPPSANGHAPKRRRRPHGSGR